MFIMRKMICFLLVLVLSLSLACPALAAVSSTGDIPPTGDTQIMMYVMVMVLALVALMAVAMFSRKAFRK